MTKTLSNVDEATPPNHPPGKIGAGKYLVDRGVDTMAETDREELAQPQSRLVPVEADEFEDLPADDYPVNGTSVDIPEPILVRESK